MYRSVRVKNIIVINGAREEGRDFTIYLSHKRQFVRVCFCVCVFFVREKRRDSGSFVSLA